MRHVIYFMNFYFLEIFVLAYTTVKLGDIANGTYKNATYLTYHAHTEWTRKGFLFLVKRK